MEPHALYRRLTVSAVRDETPGFKVFVFQEGHGISYRAGQYLTFVYNTNQAELRRSYSICSSPAVHEPLTIGVKRIENGFFSRLLTDMIRPGDELLTTGAGGFFTIPEEATQASDIFLFAAGSGITPIYAILKTLLAGYTCRVHLIYSNRAPATTVFLKELSALQSIHADKFHIEFLFGNDPDLLRARLHRDLLIRIVREQAGGDLTRSLFFICGPISYMRLCRYTLREIGVLEAQIRQEEFVIQKPARALSTPPDTGTHNVTIDLNGHTFSFDVSFPDTILAAAKRNGISLPYSCEAGRCGSCVARCTSGSIWLAYNEVLTAKELSQGLTLTCMGHPVGGNVKLTI